MLHVENLSVSFRDGVSWRKTVDGVGFDVCEGQTLGIVGESGSGKSVSLLSVMRLLNERSARVEATQMRLGNDNLLALSRSQMCHIRGRRMAMIFQEPMTSLNPVFKCGFQVVEAIRAHGRVGHDEARRRAIELFEKVLLPRPEIIFNSYPHELSGGQKQRVMIAMALACNPEILIADEPTTALDVTVQKEILALLRALQRQNGMGMVFITHDLAVVSEIADTVAVMHNGHIVEQGRARDILDNPSDPYTKGLMSCRPPMDVRLKALPVVKDFVDGKWASAAEVVKALSVDEGERRARQADMYNRAPIVSVRNLNTWFPLKKGLLNRTYDYVKAVDDVSFDVYPGETLGLVGESGCGKTTLGRSLLRLVEPKSGSVLFNGTDICSLKGSDLTRFRKRAQIVFQDPYSSLNPKMTIGEAIGEPLKVHGIETDSRKRRERVCRLLEQVGLDGGCYSRYPHEFSGGQRQRVCIARTLSLEPQIVICDESVSALDVSVQAQVLNLLNKLKEEHGFTYIFISHDLGVVRFMSDRIVVMRNGRIVETADSDALFASSENAYVRKLIDSIPGRGMKSSL